MFKHIELNRAAFTRGVSEEDIRWAFLPPRYDGPVENMENKCIRLGFDRRGRLLEIMYHEIGEQSVNVFMKCRNI